jgi:hypothetical protein
MGTQAVTWMHAGLALAVLTAAPTKGEPLPTHAGTRLLRSGSLTVEVGDPDSTACKWNKGLRFSPVANVLRVQLGGQDFFYSPVGGGALSYVGGAPMEFDIGQESFQPDPPGYNEGLSGAPFLKIGVGILRRDGSAYDFTKTYPVIEQARTTTTWQDDRVHFMQALAGTAQGYSCELEEDLIVKNDRLIMHGVLRNTGTKKFTTEQYIHNFVCFSGRSVGPNVRLSFPYTFTASPAVAAWTPPSRVRSVLAATSSEVARIADTILYTQKAPGVPKIWITKPQGYAGPDLVAVEHLDTGQRLIIGASMPSVYVGIWTTDYQVSPEQFLVMTLAPGEEKEFVRTYVFRTDGFVPEDGNGDGEVNASDLAIMSCAWLSTPLTPAWQSASDLFAGPTEMIDLQDFIALATRWRQEGGLPGPVAHWKLDEGAGTTAFDACGLHDGTLRHFSQDQSPWVAGAIGGGLDFDGIDDVVEAGGYPGITGPRPRSVTAWVKLAERTTAEQTVVAWGAREAGRYWQLEVDANRRLRLSCGTGFISVYGGVVAEAQWHHVAAVLDPVVPSSPRVTDVRLYLDAQLQGVFDLSDCPIDTADGSSLRIGGSHDPNEPHFLHGVIDDVRIYGAALATTHVRRIYAEQSDHFLVSTSR